MRPRRAAILLSLALLLLSSTFGAVILRAQSPAEDLPPLLSASEIDYPPYCVVDAQGEADGFSVQLLREAMRAMGREVTFRVGPWDDVRGWLESGQVQALPLVGRTPEREALYDFTFPYLSMHGAIVVRQEDTAVRSLGDLARRDVAVMKGDNAEEFLRREPRDFVLHTPASFEDALQGVAAGQYDAVVIQRLVALRLIESARIGGLRIIDRPVAGFTQEFSFAVREGDGEMLALLNEGLSIVMADGTFRRLYAEWLGSAHLPVAGRIIVGGDENYPPFEYLGADGLPTGYNVALTRAIAREMGLDVEIRLGPWAEIRQALEDGEIDAIQGMFYSDERDELFDFGVNHTHVDHVAVHRADSLPDPASLANLDGLRVAVMQGDLMHERVLERAGKISPTVVGSEEQALRLVAEWEADVALVARVPANYWIAENGWDNLVVGRTILERSEYSYAVAEGRLDLLSSFEEGLQALEASGEMRSIRAQWLSAYEAPSIDLARVLRYAAIILIPLFVVLVGTMVWSRQLSRQVARRTEELRQSQSQFYAMINGAPDAIIVEVAGTIAYANPAAANLVGAPSADALIGQELAGFVAPAYREDAGARVERLRGAAGTRDQETIGLLGSGGDVRVDVSAVPLTYEESDGTLIFIRDVTGRLADQEALRENERRLSVLMANLPGMAYRCQNTPGWPMDFVSEGCLDLTGYTAEELQGAHDGYSILVHPEDLLTVERAVNQGIARGETFRVGYRLVKKDGTVRHVWEQGRLAATIDGAQCLEGLVMDITEQEEAHREIARQLDELQRWQRVMLAREDRVRELKQQVNALHAERGRPGPYPSQEGSADA
ncbi:MAG: transporter substrate-binding domain-containing protein [Anaerolineae bacterium]